MNLKERKLEELNKQIGEIIESAIRLEEEYSLEISSVHQNYRKSALNLVHYMAFRSFSLDEIQEELRLMGLPAFDNVEAHVMRSLLAIKTIINHLLGNPVNEKRKGTISIKKSSKILNDHTKALFGFKSKKRRTRIMVTMPNTVAFDQSLVRNLMLNGMNCARINCAHDDAETWEKMIANIHESSVKTHKQCKVMMDLGGPKLRTGAMKLGPEVIHIKPKRDKLGKVNNPALIWLAPPTINPPRNIADVIIPIEKEWLDLSKKGDKIKFTDTRGKKVNIEVIQREGKGRWAHCYDSAYITSGNAFSLVKQKKTTEKIIEIGEFKPIENFILLNSGDQLIVHAEPTPGEAAIYNEQGKLLELAHVSCTLPEVFKDLKVGESIMFDDGSIEGVISEVDDLKILVKITHAKATGGKLRQDKGINLPDSNLSISGLTKKDKEDLPFVGKWADTVNFSFVNSVEDVQELHDELAKLGAQIGIILKIETRKAYDNLPKILLRGMQNYPLGVMIARGDLAIEIGWKNVASIQEEILRICEAAHVPDVLATQVLENLAKKGTPSRAEITDAAFAQRAECVMLNKGYHIQKAVKLLDWILKKMQRFQKKRQTILSKLSYASDLSLKEDL
jgi:pyruvate kinase